MADDKNRINQILESLASAASVAADGVSDAVQNAGNAVGGKYDEFKASTELKKLQSEQEDIFVEIGRTMYNLQSSNTSTNPQATELIDTQQLVDQLLIEAEQKQHEIDAIQKKLSKYTKGVVCSKCGKVCTTKDDYCSACGTKLEKAE